MAKEVNGAELHGRVANDNTPNAYEVLALAVFREQFQALRAAVAGGAVEDNKLLEIVGIKYNFDSDSLSWDNRKEVLTTMLPSNDPSCDVLLETARKIHVLSAAARLYEETLDEKSVNMDAKAALETTIKTYLNPFQAKKIVDEFTRQITKQNGPGFNSP